MIKTKGRRRTSIPSKRLRKQAEIEPLRFEDMYIIAKTGEKFCFYRLRFINVPTLKKIKAGNIINAGRDNEIRSIYNLFNKSSKLHPKYLQSGFVPYYRYLDSLDYKEDSFDFEIMSKCIKYYNNERIKGRHISKSTHIQISLSWYLKEVGRHYDSVKLPGVPRRPPSTRPGAFDVTQELKPIGRALHRGFSGFVTHIKEGTHPDIHPIFCEDTLAKRSIKEGWSKQQYARKRLGFKRAMSPQAPAKKTGLPLSVLRLNLLANQAGRNALYLFFMLTGMNPSPLASMQRKDVKFKDIGRGRFIFDSIKARAAYKKQDNALGFTANTKRLIQSWLDVSTILYVKKGIFLTLELPLIPYFDTSNSVVHDFTWHGSWPESVIKQLNKLLDINITPTRFRKTKSDVLMRTTESLFIVSQGLNNSLDVVARSYSDGVQSNHDNGLNAMFSAQTMISKGENLTKAVLDSKVMHSDILSEYDYKERLRKKEISVATLTPSGVRCMEVVELPTDEDSNNTPDSETSNTQSTGMCTDFLKCFNCSKHKLVASIVDIWLMLSFHEQLSILKEQVSKNSAPKQELIKAATLTSKTLDRMNKKAPKNYREALSKFESEGLHPLYVERYFLQDYI